MVWTNIYGPCILEIAVLEDEEAGCVGPIYQLGPFAGISTACTFVSSLLQVSMFWATTIYHLVRQVFQVGPILQSSSILELPDDLVITSIWSAKRSAIHRLALRCIH